MTRKEIELIARVFARAKPSNVSHVAITADDSVAIEVTRRRLAMSLASDLQEANSSFRKDLFLDACHVAVT